MISKFFSKPRRMILLGFILMLLGVIFPFLMVIHILKSTFFLNFFSYTLSLLGMIFGIMGIAFDFKGK
ncbi:MAG: hypothetical protein A2X25_05270 [Chloroflexi bacterium GWB2_49_20]|nr:MAG: hypothetical protein A2X25_05270 [Chloroflexi bacterium GWB2_49_20]OGN77820.1 MAG: hypothetical protein A2X26_02115 [Chloroflexi bacterium GWC2_49_37]